MNEAHLSLETLARLLAGDFDSEVLTNRVLPHLMEHCPACREKYEEIRQLQKEFGHWDERVGVFEGAQAPELFASIRDLPFDEQLSRVTDDSEFHTWAFCQVLLRASLESVFEDAFRAVNWAELAVRVAYELGDAYDPHWVRDLQARAYAYLGNARRVLGELRSADTAFREADECLSASLTGNMRIEAEVLHLKASLRREQRRMKEAGALVDRSLALYYEEGDRQGIGIVLLKKAKILEEVGDLEASIELLWQATEEIASESEPQLAMYARHNLMTCLSLAGRHQQAAELLPQVRDLFAKSAKPLELLRLRWTEGKIALGLGNTGEAEKIFRQLQREFLSRGMGYDAAVVSLDLAILYIREHRHEEIKRLAFEIMPVFQSRDVHRESMAALIMFQKACEEERLTVELAGQIAATLQRSQRSRA